MDKNRMKSVILNLAIIGTLILTILPATSSAAAGPWYVSTSGNDANDCLAPATPCATINAAIGKASPGDTVYVAEGTYTGEGTEVVRIDENITLSGGWDASFSAQADRTTVDAVVSRKGIFITEGITATIDRFVIQRGVGFAGNSGGGIIINQATLTLNDSVVRDNRSFYGLGIYVWGNLTLNNSVVSDNDSFGIYNGSGNVTLNNSTITRNAEVGMFNSGGSMILNNSTVSDNSASYIAGGIYNQGGNLTLYNTTITGNTAPAQGGGIVNVGNMTIQNTIIAGNSAPYHADCDGVTISSAGYNLVGDTDGCTFTPGTGDLTGLSPELGPLTGMPGSPQYHPLLSNSPAIDAGNPAGCVGSTGDLLADQRDAPRVGVCDIGAYEYTAPGAPAAVIAYSGSDQYAPPDSPFGLPLVASVLDSLGSPVGGILVTFASPLSGASGTFADTGGITTTAQTISNSLATAAAFTANGIMDGYTVTASVNGVLDPALFHLRNGSGALYVSPDGDDSNTCFEPPHPCATLYGAMNKPDAGKSIYVAQGKYTSTFLEVLNVSEDFAFSGGWDSIFSEQTGYSTLDGENARKGVSVGTGVTASLDRFIVQQSYEAGIYNQGTLSMTQVTISGTLGSGLHNLSTIYMRDSTVQGNNNSGIYNAGVLTMYNSAVIKNTIVGSGGGIYNLENNGRLNINNSTISLNSASGSGGGVFSISQDSVFLNSSTISKNTASMWGGGLYGWAHLKNTIVAGNISLDYSPSPDCYGNVYSDEYNLIANLQGCDYNTGNGDQLNIDARLSPFTDPSGVQLLRRDSPAINAGNPNGCTDHEGNPLDADQRGVARVGRCDIGAYEYDPAIDPIHYISLPVVLQNHCSDFFDDFSNPSSGWFTGEDSEGRVEYLNGEYSVLVKPTGFYWVLGAPTCDRVNYSVEADARWAGNTGASYGLIFGIQGNYEQFYAFEVNSDYQEFSLLRYDPSGWVEIVPITGSSAIHSGAESNHLKVTRNGDSIILEVNGTLLGTWSDGTITGASSSGLIVSSYSNRANARASFDNFGVTGLATSLNFAATIPDAGMDRQAQVDYYRKVYRQGNWR